MSVGRERALRARAAAGDADAQCELATLLPLPNVNSMLAIGFGGQSQQMSEKADDLREVLLRNVSAFEKALVNDP